MKCFLIAAAVAATTVTIPAHAADVGVSISIGEPGYYGRLDINDYPPPQVIYQQPIAIERVPMDRPPIYLRVPPGYARHWDRHCREYHACDERVFFVQDNWYSREYVPRYRKQHRMHQDERQGENWHHDHEQRPSGDYRYPEPRGY